MQYPTFAGHNLRFETARLVLRPFERADFDTAYCFYQDLELRSAMEGDPNTLVTRDYLERGGEYMSRRGFGREVVECLMAYAFKELQIDRLCAMDVDREHLRSQSLFRACGFEAVRDVEGGKTIDLEIRSERNRSD
jgi:hypothetical protein